jgi:dipeptidyl aminopeptidase/acylaminoacyl peptidase
VNQPILLIHGEADENSGTFPMQSERFYAALKGHGATVRYVVLPLEGHGYRARESVMHALAEMVEWMDRWVKHAEPVPAAATAGAASATSDD